MTIVLRSVKGGPLTHAELDGNFIDLDNRVAAFEATPVTFTSLLVGNNLPGSAAGTVHVHTQPSGGLPNPIADDLVVENNTSSTGISILSPATTYGNLVFGNPNDNDEGKISYQSGTAANLGHMEFWAASQLAMTIDPNRRLGIGTATPSFLLQVHHSTTPQISLSNTTTGLSNGFNLALANDDGYIDNRSTGDSIFRIGAGLTEIFRITSTDIKSTKPLTLTGVGLAKVQTTDASGLYIDANTGGGMYLQSDGNFYFRGSAGLAYAERVRITTAGNVGIGISAPEGKLHVVVADAGVATVSGGGDDFILENNTQCGASILAPASSQSNLYFGNPNASAEGRISYYHGATANTGRMEISAASLPAIYINSSQNVGIGIQNPDGRLHVHTSTAGVVTAHADADDLIVESSANTGISLLSPDANTSQYNLGSPSDNQGAFVSWNYNANLMSVSTLKTSAEVAIKSGNNAEAIRINASQLVGIGTTTPTNARLHVAQTIGGELLRLSDTGSATTTDANPYLTFWHGVGTTRLGYLGYGSVGNTNLTLNNEVGIVDIYSNNVVAVTIDASQNVGIGTATPDGQLHVYTGNSTVATPSTLGDDLIVENSTNGGISILNTASNTGRLIFGNPNNVAEGRLEYTAGATANTGLMYLAARNATILTLQDGVQVGAPTGGDKGAGTINATAIYSNGSLLVPGGGYWTQVGSDIYYTTGKVGIGITTPDTTLHVHSSSAGTVVPATVANDLVVERGGAHGGISIITDDTHFGFVVFTSPSTVGGGAAGGGWISYRYSDATMNIATAVAGSQMILRSGANIEAVWITSSQNVGVGIAAPDGRFHVWTASAGAVTASTSADEITVENNGPAGISILTPASNSGSLFFGNANSNSEGRITYTAGATAGTGHMEIWVVGSEAIRIASDQGTYTTGATGGSKGSGTINATGLYINGSQVLLPTAASGFTFSDRVFFADSPSGETNVGSVIGSTYETVGPTGSGATNIATVLDGLPTSAKRVLLRLRSSDVSTAAGDAQTQVSIRPNGSASTDAALIAHVNQHHAGAASDSIRSSTFVWAMLDASNIFEMALVKTNMSSVYLGLSVWGYSE